MWIQALRVAVSSWERLPGSENPQPAWVLAGEARTDFWKLTELPWWPNGTLQSCQSGRRLPRSLPSPELIPLSQVSVTLGQALLLLSHLKHEERTQSRRGSGEGRGISAGARGRPGRLPGEGSEGLGRRWKAQHSSTLGKLIPRPSLHFLLPPPLRTRGNQQSTERLRARPRPHS